MHISPKFFYRLICIYSILLFSCQGEQKEKSSQMVTHWGETLDVKNVHQEYPRPQMVRNEWLNLNGFWNYTIVSEENTLEHDGKILVPYPVESILSGVTKRLSESQQLVYQREVTIPKGWAGQRIMLHFGACDFHSKVKVNGQVVGEHKGGYNSFSFDITPFLLANSDQEIQVTVNDPTDKANQSRGKQVSNPGGIYYTPSSGIWQTVWLEPVPENYIQNLKITTDIDNSSISLKVNTNDPSISELSIEINFKGEEVYRYQGEYKQEYRIMIPDQQLWSPDSPNLYDIQVSIPNDTVTSYFGMRNIELSKPVEQQMVMLFNNESLFQNGVLDQGYWPDGLYTAPSDEALKSDIIAAKKLGFNMLRKHVKVEPDRFYYWCDVLGMLVWQDMPSGDKKIGNQDPDIEKSKEGAAQFEYELEKMVTNLYNHPSIVMWIPFNEGWGQYDTERIVAKVKALDSTRMVSNASGWTDRGVGDIFDIHPYPEPQLPEAQKNRAIVIGEFGGISYLIPGHVWSDQNWGYKSIDNESEFLDTYERYYTDVWHFYDEYRLSAAVYTQLTDVETETNGLITYDRKKVKANIEDLNHINTRNYLPVPVIKPEYPPFNTGDTVTIHHSGSGTIHYTLDGSEPKVTDQKYNTPIILKKNTTVKACVFHGNLKSRIDSISYVETDTKRPSYQYPYEKYTGGGDFALIDGRKGSLSFGDGKWQGFYGNDLDIIIDFQKDSVISSINVNFLTDSKSWIFPPSSISISIWYEEQGWKEISNQKTTPLRQHKAPGIDSNSISGNFKASKIRVQAKNIGVCPEWHEGAGKRAWLFVDEIEIN